LVHQGAFASGGAGMIITEATAIVPEGRISPVDLGIWSEEHIAPLKRVTDFIHSQGALAGIQLAHAGRKASASWPWADTRGSLNEDQGGWETFGTTDAPFGRMKAPTAASIEYIEHIIEQFGVAAERAVRAGYDLVEIHAAHGYFIHTFLSPVTNTRSDEYGGDRAGRSLILVKILQRVRKAVGDRPICVRFSGTDYVDGGLDSYEVAELAKIAVEHGADIFDLSSGGLEPGVTMEIFPGYQANHARVVKEQTGALTAAVGIITEPEHAESILRSGGADIVMVGREFLRNPHFGSRAAAALGEDPTIFTPKQYQRAPYSKSIWLNHIEHVVVPSNTTQK
ncbi:MAG: tRNA-dihydrouridine synthase, partial [Microbacteriaceae bacterium]